VVEGWQVTICGDSRQVRDLLYFDDLISAIRGLHSSGANEQEPPDVVAVAVDCTKTLWYSG
jgi:dTDP-D-glucose 4,6-dehydratase